MLAVEAAGGLCEVTLGLYSEGHSWFQLAPTYSPQDTDEITSQDVGTSAEKYLRNSKTPHKAEQRVGVGEWGGEGLKEKQSCEHQGQRRRRGVGAPGTRAETMPEQVSTL